MVYTVLYQLTSYGRWINAEYPADNGSVDRVGLLLSAIYKLVYRAACHNDLNGRCEYFRHAHNLKLRVVFQWMMNRIRHKDLPDALIFA